MMLALERDKDLEASEKQRLEEEILAKAEEIQQMQTDVDEKEQETLRLQEEINEANLQMQVPDLDMIKAARIRHAYITIKCCQHCENLKILFNLIENQRCYSNGKCYQGKSSKWRCTKRKKWINELCFKEILRGIFYT